MTDLTTTNEMPADLAVKGKGILKVLQAADKAAYDYEVKTQTAAQMVLEAKAICEENKYAFTKFTKVIGLGKSRAYELLAIAQGKKSVDEVRAATAARQRKLQEARKAAAEGDEEDSEGEGTGKASKASQKRPSSPLGAFDLEDFVEHAGDVLEKNKGDKEAFLNWLHDELVQVCRDHGVDFEA